MSVHTHRNSRNRLEQLCPHFPALAQQVITAAHGNGKAVALTDRYKIAEALFAPDPGRQYLDLHYPDLEGHLHPEVCVAVHPNGVSVKATDPGNAARPAADGFLMGTPGDYSKKQLTDLYRELTPRGLLDTSIDWLSKRNLAVIPARVCNDVDVLSIVPAKSAWQYLAWDLIHGVPTLKQCLRRGFNPQALVLNVPGIRHSLFGGQHVTTFYIEDDGLMVILANTSYMGTGYAKKPMFMFQNWRLAQQGGILNHATLAIVRFGEHEETFIYLARSGNGKTEQGLPVATDPAGRFHFGSAPGLPDVWLNYPLEHHCEVIRAGDDAAVTRELKPTPDGLGIAENGEKEGLFDRTTAPDLEPNQRLFGISKPETMLGLNYHQVLGEPLDVYAVDEVGRSNPRQTYPWELLRRLGVKYTTDPVKYGHRVYGMGLLKEWAALSWTNRLPRRLGYLHRLVGWCKAKSKSVIGVGSEVGMISDWAGTVGCFSPLSLLDHANLIWRETLCFPAVKDWMVPVGYVGKYKLPTEYDGEQFYRDFMVHLKAGNASWELIPAESPIFGLRPSNVTFFGQELPELFCSPAQQLGSEYFSIAERFKEEYLKLLLPLAGDPRLAEGARQTIRMFEQLKPGGYSPTELRQIYVSFDRIDG